MPRVTCPECDKVLKVAADFDRPFIRCPGCKCKIPWGGDEKAAKGDQARPLTLGIILCAIARIGAACVVFAVVIPGGILIAVMLLWPAPAPEVNKNPPKGNAPSQNVKVDPAFEKALKDLNSLDTRTCV